MLKLNYRLSKSNLFKFTGFIFILNHLKEWARAILKRFYVYVTIRIVK